MWKDPKDLEEDDLFASDEGGKFDVWIVEKGKELARSWCHHALLAGVREIAKIDHQVWVLTPDEAKAHDGHSGKI